MNTQIVVDASNMVLGRLASYAAKQALLGKSVIIVNCDNAVLTGSKANVIAEYEDIRKKGGASLRGPFFPKHPDRMVKRTVRGMLSYKQGRGEAALKRVICYNDTPKEYESSKKKIQSISAENKTIKTIKMGEISRII